MSENFSCRGEFHSHEVKFHFMKCLGEMTGRMAGKRNDLHIATSSRLSDCTDSQLKHPTVCLMNIADLRRSSACSRSNCRRFAHITAQREAFLGSCPARASATARAASSGCWLTYGLSAGRCFQRLKIDLLLSLATSSAAARARRRRLPRPRRAQGRSIRPAA